MNAQPITLEALELLDAIDRRGSFAKAAEELNKATSALSYGVQKLEEQLKLTVFVRQGRRSVLTPAGRLLLDEGRLILKASALLADKAREVASGWEPRLKIAVESTLDYEVFFKQLLAFLTEHSSVEIDVCESVLNGGWEALEHDRVDLVIGVPGPVPIQKGFRALPIGNGDMIPVIASQHPLAHLANSPEALKAALPKLRRVITHDTATVSILRNAGLSLGDSDKLYVQNMDQKIHALCAGLGIGHLPRHRAQSHLDSGHLLALSLNAELEHNFIAWKLANKGRALHTLSARLATTMGNTEK